MDNTIELLQTFSILMIALAQVIHIWMHQENKEFRLDDYLA